MPLAAAVIPDEAQHLSMEATVSPRRSACLRLQICNKGTCRKRGSAKLRQALEATIHDTPDLHSLTVETTGCLKACKKGPNLRILPSGKVLHHLTPDAVPSLLPQLALSSSASSTTSSLKT